MNLMGIPKNIPFPVMRAIPMEMLRTRADIALSVGWPRTDFRVISIEGYSICGFVVREFLRGR